MFYRVHLSGRVSYNLENDMSFEMSSDSISHYQGAAATGNLQSGPPQIRTAILRDREKSCSKFCRRIKLQAHNCVHVLQELLPALRRNGGTCGNIVAAAYTAHILRGPGHGL
jgi:hypothetical protein